MHLNIYAEDEKSKWHFQDKNKELSGFILFASAKLEFRELDVSPGKP